MIQIPIAGFKTLRIHHLVLDFNGTIGRDGRLIDGVRERLRALSRNLQLHVLTADTFGQVAGQVAEIPCELVVIPEGREAEAKLDHVVSLGHGTVACVGNGRNDALMLEHAALGIGVIQTEGCAREAFLAADIVTTSILDALDLLAFPMRLTATLRS